MNAAASPLLPPVRGPLSALVVETLKSASGSPVPPLPELPTEPLRDDDLQLALYLLYELHYRSFEAVDPDWEWDPGLIAARLELERAFDEALAAAVPRRPDVRPGDVGDLLFELSEADPAPSLSRYLAESGTRGQIEEFMIHRSAYQLKEADPHSWGLPRLDGPPKAALVEIQADEYGSGRHERMHSVLFARAMDAVGLDSSYGAYLERLPGTTLATVNLISAFGLRRRRRGALVGHLAMFEITSPLPNRRYARALRRLGFGADATAFFDEHVEADSVHENIAAFDLAQGLALEEPALTADVIFGAEALLHLEGAFAGELLEAFQREETSLLSQPVGSAAR